MQYCQIYPAWAAQPRNLHAQNYQKCARPGNGGVCSHPGTVAIIVLVALRYLGPIINGVLLKVACTFNPNVLKYVHFVDYDTGVLMSCDDLKE